LRNSFYMNRSAPWRLLFAVSIAGFWTPATSQVAVSEQLETWYTQALKRAPGLWGVVVADENGDVLWSVNGTEPMTPASTVKVLTTGFARSQLGGDARLPTRVVGTGAVDPSDGSWQGTWALELNGDPTFGRPDVDGPTLSDLAEQLSQIGVQRLTGPFAVTTATGAARSTYPTAWAARHRGRYFAPPVGPITINENLVAFTVMAGDRSGRPAELTADLPSGTVALVTMNAKTVAGRTNRLTIRANGDGWVVSGTIGVNASPRRYTFVAHNPVAVVEAAWGAALDRVGIQWDRTASISSFPRNTSRVLAEVASPTFDAIASEVNRRSVNIGAELMLRWGGGATGAASQLEAHVRAVTGLTDGIRLVDGSGLSDNDRVSPVVFTTYLANFPRTAAGRDFPLLLPANGSGTLRSLATGLPERGVVRAKTGSLNNTSTLVGYLGRPEGMLVVAAMYNGPRTSNARQAQWELFRSLGAEGVVIPPTGDEGVEATLGGEAVGDR
jgi:D-alanyl-D-alanine carboxypeptidase/D-alanyl-D-alanine-endopeptidase (penicillin-binding protein 4)